MTGNTSNPTSELDGGRTPDGKFAPGSKPNKTGKGGFQERPEDINTGGRPRKQESFTYWLNYFKNLTTKEFLAWERDNPDNVRTVAADLAYVRVRKSRNDLREFKEVAERTEGKSIQRTDLNSTETIIHTYEELSDEQLDKAIEARKNRAT